MGGYVALAGEFSVLAELALRRLDGTLTLGHTKEIDILALNRATGRTFKLEVKTTAKGARGSRTFGASYAWLMDEAHGEILAEDQIYVFVALSRNARPKFFLVPSADVAAYIRVGARALEAARAAPDREGLADAGVPSPRRGGPEVEAAAVVARRALAEVGRELGDFRPGPRRWSSLGDRSRESTRMNS